MTASRNFSDWIEAYLDYSSHSEAPKRMRFWCAVSAVAGALRRRVWLDMAYFQWYPNFFIVLVAPPGIVSKSTTAGVAINLLRQVPGVKFGPDVCTWQSLVKSLADNQEAYQVNGHDFVIASELTIESSELGNLLNPHDREMVDLLITLWDSRKVFSKTTKMSGSDHVENPWINIIACTTPSWLAGNFPDYMIGGGFTSRCVFVYAEEKEKYVAYPSLQVPTDLSAIQKALIQDLEAISLLSGPYRLLPSAVDWGNAWYRYHYENRPAHLNDERFGGYIARKQTHLHKLAMVLAASQRSELTLTAEDLSTAEAMLKDIELDMPKVFARIGRTEASNAAERFLGTLRASGALTYEAAYRFLHQHFPAGTDMENILKGLLQSGQIRVENVGGQVLLKPATIRAANEATP